MPDVEQMEEIINVCQILGWLYPLVIDGSAQSFTFSFWTPQLRSYSNLKIDQKHSHPDLKKLVSHFGRDQLVFIIPL